MIEERFLGLWDRVERGPEDQKWGERTLRRCARVWNAANAGPADQLVALRQAVRLVGAEVPLRAVPDELLKRAPEFGLSIVRSVTGFIVAARDYVGRPEMGDVRPFLFDARPGSRQNYSQVPTDPWTFARTGNRFHRLPDQRNAIRAMLSCPDGGILAVSLPTGGGKSRVTLLPLLASQKGATVTVVPTVALALDQVDKAREILGEGRAACLIGRVTPDERAAVFERLLSGELRALFLGPEMLVGPAYGPLTSAVRKNRVTTLAIDEVHLMSQWGREFRPEYSLLGEVRREWFEASGRTLRTALLSATWSASLLEEMERVFSTGGEWRFIDAGALRCEHDLVAMQLADEQTRNRLLLDVLRHTPRPAIVYVTRKRDTVELRKWLSSEECGFRRVEAFSGETTDDAREELVARWNEDDFDIMVATSAFGVGVDKPDVRVVVHACMPESVDRYYQEIGRAGRDGHAALAILCPVKHKDSLDATRLSAHHSAENARERIDDLYEQSDSVQEGCRIFRKFTLDVMRAGIRERASSDDNRRWNKATLGWMHRKELLKVQLSQLEKDGVWWAEVLSPDTFTKSARSKGGPLEQSLLADTERHYEEARPGLERLQELASKPRTCAQALFADVYRLPTQLYGLCGRCPHCGFMRNPISLRTAPRRSPPWSGVALEDRWRALIEYGQAEVENAIEVLGAAGYVHFLCSERVRTMAAPILNARARDLPSSSPTYLSTFHEHAEGHAPLEPVPTVVVLSPGDESDSIAHALFRSHSDAGGDRGSALAFLMPVGFSFTRDTTRARHLYTGPVADLAGRPWER